jgi:hypothetical protein
MNEQPDQTILLFRKTQNGKDTLCRIQAFSDGSAIVEGDELEIIFEESPDALHQAIAYLEDLGYTRSA